MRGFTISLVRIAQSTFLTLQARRNARLIKFAAVVCLLLMCVSSYDALHVHGSGHPLESAPQAPHHCLLRLAAHLPITINALAAVPIPRYTCATPLPPENAGS
jgi:hypothetical protein